MDLSNGLLPFYYNPSYTSEEFLIKKDDSLEHIQFMERNAPIVVALYKRQMNIPNDCSSYPVR